MSDPVDTWATEAAEGTVLLLIRHGEQRTMLEVDPELSDRGRAQAERLARRLEGLPIDHIASSPLRRALGTAQPLAESLGLEIDVRPDLEEVRMPEEVVRERFSRARVRAMEPRPEDYAPSVLGAIDVVPRFRFTGSDGAESAEELRDRAVGVLADLVERSGARVVAAFTHGAFINAATGTWLGMDRLMWFVPWHTGVTALRATNGALVPLTVNDASHLAPDEDVLGIVARGAHQ